MEGSNLREFSDRLLTFLVPIACAFGGWWLVNVVLAALGHFPIPDGPSYWSGLPGTGCFIVVAVLLYRLIRSRDHGGWQIGRKLLTMIVAAALTVWIGAKLSPHALDSLFGLELEGWQAFGSVLTLLVATGLAQHHAGPNQPELVSYYPSVVSDHLSQPDWEARRQRIKEENQIEGIRAK